MSESDADPLQSGFAARSFSTLAAGEEFWGALTVTESHVVTAAGIFNDPGPNHVNEAAARAGRFEARVAHGPLLIGIADGVLGNALGATIVALLEQSASFLRPVYIGDTITPHWTVRETTSKKSFGGGIVVFDGEILGSGSQRLVELTATLAVAAEPPWTPWQPGGGSRMGNRPQRNRQHSDRSDQ